MLANRASSNEDRKWSVVVVCWGRIPGTAAARGSLLVAVVRQPPGAFIPLQTAHLSCFVGDFSQFPPPVASLLGQREPIGGRPPPNAACSGHIYRQKGCRLRPLPLWPPPPAAGDGEKDEVPRGCVAYTKGTCPMPITAVPWLKPRDRPNQMLWKPLQYSSTRGPACAHSHLGRWLKSHPQSADSRRVWHCPGFSLQHSPALGGGCFGLALS